MVLEKLALIILFPKDCRHEKKAIKILTIIVLSFPIFSYAQEHIQTNIEGIHFFEGTWNEALDKAKNENKPIFLDVYATWCGPCKVLKRKTFPDAEAGKYFNENYINVSLDGEKEDGKIVVQKFEVMSLKYTRNLFNSRHFRHLIINNINSCWLLVVGY